MYILPRKILKKSGQNTVCAFDHDRVPIESTHRFLSNRDRLVSTRASSREQSVDRLALVPVVLFKSLPSALLVESHVAHAHYCVVLAGTWVLGVGLGPEFGGLLKGGVVVDVHLRHP